MQDSLRGWTVAIHHATWGIRPGDWSAALRHGLASAGGRFVQTSAGSTGDVGQWRERAAEAARKSWWAPASQGIDLQQHGAITLVAPDDTAISLHPGLDPLLTCDTDSYAAVERGHIVGLAIPDLPTTTAVTAEMYQQLVASGALWQVWQLFRQLAEAHGMVGFARWMWQRMTGKPDEGGPAQETRALLITTHGTVEAAPSAQRLSARFTRGTTELMVMSGWGSQEKRRSVLALKPDWVAFENCLLHRVRGGELGPATFLDHPVEFGEMKAAHAQLLAFLMERTPEGVLLMTQGNARAACHYIDIDPHGPWSKKLDGHRQGRPVDSTTPPPTLSTWLDHAGTRTGTATWTLPWDAELLYELQQRMGRDWTFLPYRVGWTVQGGSFWLQLGAGGPRDWVSTAQHLETRVAPFLSALPPSLAKCVKVQSDCCIDVFPVARAQFIVAERVAKAFGQPPRSIRFVAKGSADDLAFAVANQWHSGVGGFTPFFDPWPIREKDNAEELASSFVRAGFIPLRGRDEFHIQPFMDGLLF